MICLALVGFSFERKILFLFIINYPQNELITINHSQSDENSIFKAFSIF